jgi:hypothetical protein
MSSPTRRRRTDNPWHAALANGDGLPIYELLGLSADQLDTCVCCSALLMHAAAQPRCLRTSPTSPHALIHARSPHGASSYIRLALMHWLGGQTILELDGYVHLWVCANFWNCLLPEQIVHTSVR